MKEKMKLTKSKQFLADTIHASGNGWPDGATHTAQDRNGFVTMFAAKPVLVGGTWECNDHAEVDVLHTKKISPNWHQTCLSREEYFSAYPAEPVADADGWIEWKAKFYEDMPCEEDAEVDIKVGDEIYYRYVAKCWKHWGSVTAYRLHKPEVKPEFCESVTRSIPDPDAKPSIEQLAADYRNANDYAGRKQQEADAAKDDAEAKLAAYIAAAGSAVGVILSVAGADMEHERVITNWNITNWKDLQIGDEVEVTSVHTKNNYPYEHVIGKVAKVVCVEDPSCQMLRVKPKAGGRELLIDGFKFIRRP